jgi:hypothetical protein
MSDVFCDAVPEEEACAPGHCTHSREAQHENDEVCCWCGDLFLGDDPDGTHRHGPYKPPALVVMRDDDTHECDRCGLTMRLDDEDVYSAMAGKEGPLRCPVPTCVGLLTELEELRS